MSNQRIASIAIIGGGSAGWMTAAALSSALSLDMDEGCRITLVESEAIGTVGVGEATIPPIQQFNQTLGISETEFVKATSGSFKLGIQFVDWLRDGHSYFHPFGSYGIDFDRLPIHQHWLKARRDGYSESLDDFCMAWVAAKGNKFHPASKDKRTVQSTYDHAYHFDTGLYAAFLRARAEAAGVRRVEGKINDVGLNGESGFVERVALEDGTTVNADFFIDCTGFRGLLIGQALGVDYLDWTHWLPCDRAVALGSVSEGEPTPYTRATALEAGWQWRIPLQHRTGNGYVYCSQHLSDDEAASTLLNQVDGKPIGTPRALRFTTGRRESFWHKNCVAIGLSAGFMEPLESTSLHLIQTAIRRLLALFPDKQFSPLSAQEFNRITVHEYETIRDFLILHYHANRREDGDLWSYCRSMSVPETLIYKIDQFRAYGRLVSDGLELFANPSWLAVLIGQGIEPEHVEPLMDQRINPNSLNNLNHLREVMEQVAAQMPSHADYIKCHCRAPVS